MPAQLLFSGKLTSTEVNLDGTLTISVSEEELSFTTIDKTCSIYIHDIADALGSLRENEIISIVTPCNIISELMVVRKEIVMKSRLFLRPLRYLRISFVGDDAMAALLRCSCFQIYRS